MASDNRPFARRVLTVVLIVGVVAFLAFIIVKVKGTLVVAFAAWITAVVLEIPVRTFQRWRMSRIVAVILTLLLALIIILLVLAMVVPAAVQQISALIERLPDLTDQALSNYEVLRLNVPAMLRSILPRLPHNLEALLEPAEDLLPAGIPDLGTLFTRSLPVLSNVASFIGVTVAQVILYVFLTILLLLEPVDYYQAIVSLVPHEAEQRTLEIINRVRHNVERWFGAMLISIAVTSLLYFIALGLIVQLPNALALSIIAGISTIVPVVGNTLALIPVVIIAASMGLPKLLLSVALYVAVGITQDRIVTPAIMRSELNIPAAGQIVFQLIFAALIGPVGLLLAVPLLAIIITLARQLYVFDILGKRGRVTLLDMDREGTLVPAGPPAKKEEKEAETAGA